MPAQRRLSSGHLAPDPNAVASNRRTGSCAHRTGCPRWIARAARTSLLLVLALLASHRATPSPDQPATTVFSVLPAALRCRHRVGARPGDLALQNARVTAIVSRENGWLVDFWTNQAQPSTAPQPEGTPNVDGLWLLHPVLDLGRGPFHVVADTVAAHAGTVRTETTLAAGAGRLRLVTTYRLDADLPRLFVESVLSHAAGGRIAHAKLGDRIKWGNVDYWVEGRGRQPFEFHGRGRWVGRHGAGGDLLLQALLPDSMRIDYRARLWGSAPEIHTSYAGASIAADHTLTVRRVLTYETLPQVPLPSAPTGTLVLALTDEGGHPLPAKLSFRGQQGTADPDFGNDGGLDGAGRFAWSGTGEFSRTLPPGRYLALATAGPERAAAEITFEIEAGQVVRRRARLPRVVTTPGWIAADLHLHQVPSVDAGIGLAARIVSIAAEGIELAAATDHFTVTDLAPTVAALRKSGQLAGTVQTIGGTEVSPVGHRFGHFNVFPLQPDDWIDYEDTTPERLFSEVRKVAPGAILQVNHPRWSEVGYWHRYRLDPRTGRVPARFRKQYRDDFDAVEILNGWDATSEPKFRQVLHDWLHLLGQGHRYTATGNSDSHKLFFVDPGLPRNLIRYGDAASDADDRAADPAQVIAAVRAGHVVVTTGPMIDASIEGTGPGGTVRAKRGRVALDIRVRAAPWIDVSELEVLVGRKGHRVRWLPIPPSTEVLRFEETFDLRVQGKTFLVVLVRGRKPLPNVYAPNARPLAFTNPIWIE